MAWISNILWKRYLRVPVVAPDTCFWLQVQSLYNNSQLTTNSFSLIDGIAWQPCKLLKHTSPLKKKQFLLFQHFRLKMQNIKWYPMIMWPNNDMCFWLRRKLNNYYTFWVQPDCNVFVQSGYNIFVVMMLFNYKFISVLFILDNHFSCFKW